jgi:hypothetical protein
VQHEKVDNVTEFIRTYDDDKTQNADSSIIPILKNAKKVKLKLKVGS